ncbi:MAG: hypothetical protein ACOY94_11735 [Bacillota bacterium]
MKPLYWWLLGAAVLIIAPLKLYAFKKIMAKRQEAEQQRTLEE